MAGLEVAVISLGAAVVKSACRVRLGDRPFAGGVTSELADLFAGREQPFGQLSTLRPAG